jgi:iron complex transport system ATP-binding protein
LVKIQVEKVSFKYGDGLQALDNVSMDMQEGEFVCLVGPNGSGKSTMLKCLLKIFKPQKGKIRLDEVNLEQLALSNLAKQIGYVPQSMQHVFPVTVFEAILTGRIPHLGWAPKDSDLKKVEEIMKQFSVEAWAWRSLFTLSGGERQKVLIAMTLAKEPPILLLDEPTSNLDLKHQLEVMDILKRLVKEQKLTVVMAIHDLNLALQYADKVVMMKTGKVVAHGSPLTVFTKENIQEVFGVEVEIVDKQKNPFIRAVSPAQKSIEKLVNKN